MLSNEQKKRFQEIWAKRFGREISDEDADREGGRIARIVQLICRPTTADESKDTQKRRRETEPKQ